MNIYYITFSILFIQNQTNINNTNSTNVTSNNITLNNQKFCSQKISRCLSCRESICWLCDIFAGYFLNDDFSSCVSCSETDPLCSFSLTCGSCQICRANSTLCFGKCRLNLDNCIMGDTCSNTCQKCSLNYVLTDGNCVRSTNPITNCSQFTNPDLCSSCNVGYTMTVVDNLQTCILNETNINNNTANNTTVATNNTNVAVNNTINTNTINNQTNSTNTTIENCFVHLGGNYTCSSCINSDPNSSIFYKYDITNPYKNLELNFLNNSSSLNTLISSFRSIDSFNSLINKNEVCVSRNINNCLTINQTTFECESCETNYYLSNGVCLRLQQSMVIQCSSYIVTSGNDINGFNPINCNTCNEGFYLSQGLCIQFNMIKGCSSYNGDRSLCITCNNIQGYKLVNNTCVRILNFVKVINCSNYNNSGANEGKCSSCNSSFVIDNVNNRCLTINNCMTVSYVSNVLSCTTCNIGYQLNSLRTKCVRINPDLNCMNINQTTNNCTSCNPDYFLINNKCENVRKNIKYISNCNNGMSNWLCQTCKNNYIRVPTIYECYPKINDCLFYNDTNGRCILCDNNKIPNSTTGLCTGTAPEIGNCRAHNGTKCVACNNNYFFRVFNANQNICVREPIEQYSLFCKYNPPTILTSNDRINTTNISQSNNNIVYTYNCVECIYPENMVIDTANRLQCIPKLVSNSNNPYQYASCNLNQMRTKFHNNNTILTCRSLETVTSNSNIYFQDLNCYIYNSNWRNYTSFGIGNLCAVCKSGYTVLASNIADPTSGNNFTRCLPIRNCREDLTKFGGCNTCINNTFLDIDGNNCRVIINNCKVLSNDNCLECNSNFYGIIKENVNSNYAVGDNGLSKILGFGGNAFSINYRNDLGIKIPRYKYFFYNTTSGFIFSSCSNTPLFSSNGNFTSNRNQLNQNETNFVLATNLNEQYAAYCRAGYYLKYSTTTLDYRCSLIELTGNSRILNIYNNNYLKQGISNNCGTNNHLFLSTGKIKGPFCTTVGATSIADPLTLQFTAIGNCSVHFLNWTYGANNVTDANTRCIFCGGNNIVNGNMCENWAAPATAIIAPCSSYNSLGECMSCDNSMIMVNNACINPNQNLYSTTNASAFRTQNNCNLIAWNHPLIGVGYRNAFQNIPGNNNGNVATCVTCNPTTYVMNYTNFSCVKKNKFDFVDCLSSQDKVGCVSCINGKFSFGANTEHEFCIPIPNNSDFLNTTGLVTNCSIYNYNNNSLFECSVCNTGYSVSNNLCFPLLSNCSALVTTNPQMCQTCRDGYYLTSGSCMKGNIFKCISYTSQYICSRCENNYTLWGDNNYVTCIDTTPIKSSLNNCTEVRSLPNSQNLYCFCENGRIPVISTTIDNSICLPNYINNCISYNQVNITLCIQCASDKLTDNTLRNNLFILNNNVCMGRTPSQLIDNCLVYRNNEVMCSTCNRGFYLNRLGKCIRNPIAQPNCLYSLSNGNCSICNNNYYFNSDNICTAVDSNNVVTNCYKYNNNQQCSICNRGYLINNNQCVPLSIANFLDENNSCVFNIFEGYPNNSCTCKNKNFYYNSTQKRCLEVLNCLVASNDGSCMQCTNGLYYNTENNVCENVTTTITRCNLYSNNGTCSKCENNFILINNQCNEVPILDRITKCDNYSVEPKCILCNPGQFINNGTCQNITSNGIYFSSYNNESLALICNTGYEMNENRNCIPASNSTTSSNSQIIKKFILVIFASIFFK